MKWILIGVAIFAVIALLVYLSKKYSAVKTTCFFVLYIALVASAFFSCVNLNNYYSAEGGIFGYISELFREEVEVEELKFTLKNVELKQVLDSDTYQLKIYSEDIVKIEEGKNYEIYVNNVLSETKEFSQSHVFTTYTHAFYGNDRELLLVDTLEIDFVFEANQSYLLVQTHGGSEAVKYWHYYFNRNNFVVSFEEVDYISNEDLNYTEGETPETCVVTYVVDGVESKNLLKVGMQISNITYSPIATNIFYKFDGWTLDGETIVNPNYTIQEDTTLIASFSLADAGLYGEDGEMTASWQELIDNGIINMNYGTASFWKEDPHLLEGVLIVSDDVNSIGRFDETYLKAVYLPDSVLYIGDKAFDMCTKLKQIFLSENLAKIGDYAFRGCALQEIDIPEGVTYIGSSAFQSCTSLKSIKVPESITKILSHTFYGCSLLSEVTLPTKLTKIGSYAFYGCTSLKSIEIPETVETIEGMAFSDTSLKTIFIPKSVVTIVAKEDSAGIFNSCELLNAIYCEVEEKPEGWGVNWDLTWISSTTSTRYTTYWGYTYEAYLAEIQ